MDKKHLCFYIISMGLALIAVYAYGYDKWSSDNIKYLTPDDIKGEPEKAKQRWTELSDTQKTMCFMDNACLRGFSDKFAADNGIKSLDLKYGKSYYDGTSLVNGNTEIPLVSLKNAEVIALEGGGFRVKYPDGSDLRNLNFNGGDKGILIEGSQLTLPYGSLSNGIATYYEQAHIRIEPHSIFKIDDVEFETKSQGLDVYYNKYPESDSFVEIDSLNKKIRIVGDDLTVRFDEDNKFQTLFVNGRITVVDGDLRLEFDGKGNAAQDIPLEDPKSKLVVIDENAPDKKYVLEPRQGLDDADGTLEGFGGCTCPLLTGNIILDITGRQSKDSCICKGPLVMTGTTINKKAQIPYEANLKVNEEQMQNVLKKFAKTRNGKLPDSFSEKDINEISRLVTQEVSDMKLEQKFLNNPPLLATEYRIKIALKEDLKRAGLEYNSLSEIEKDFVEKIVPEIGAIEKSTIFEFQKSGDKGLVVIKPTGQQPRYIETSGKIIGAYQSKYVPDFVKEYLQNKIALKK